MGKLGKGYPIDFPAHRQFSGVHQDGREESCFAIDFTRINDVLYGADQAGNVRAFFHQVIDELSMELYGGYCYYNYDAEPNSGGLKLHDIHVGFDSAFSPAVS